MRSVLDKYDDNQLKVQNANDRVQFYQDPVYSFNRKVVFPNDATIDQDIKNKGLGYFSTPK